ncbi:MAG: alginate export family protein [Alphaproteobacteria bacterium]|nr:alginate export family protein [Alphaproteobacteria bacterium]
MSSRAAAVMVAVLCLSSPRPASAQVADADPPPARPAILFNRWQEDWSVLADPTLRTEPFDDLKYIPLWTAVPGSYLSLGLNLRERFESNAAPSFGIGRKAEDYVIQRLEIDSDLHLDRNWQVFVQLEDDRAFGNITPSPVDADQLDLEQGFVAYTTPFAGGDLKFRVGRQEIGFDLQRFVSVRDGPNVRQAFDAAWLDWEASPWRVITFWSRPVQYRNTEPFDDYSNGRFQYGGFRVERKEVGPGSLSAYYSRYQLDDAHYLFAAGEERRDILDLRYAGALAGFDWDLEAMGQGGEVGAKAVRAWAVGTLTGYTFSGFEWRPRLGLQVDAASGNQHADGNKDGTFNPLFPNGYYLTLAGYTGYVNLIHVKPSVTVEPIAELKVMAATGLQWRETVSDAIYTQPNIAVPGTAGTPGRWTGAYGQLRADYAFNGHLSGAVEAVHFAVGDAIRRAGGHDSDYVGVELKFGW